MRARGATIVALGLCMTMASVVLADPGSSQHAHATTDAETLASIVPARLLETRTGESTVDGQFQGIGRRPAGSVTEVTIAGRGGVPADAQAVVLNVTAVSPSADGFLTGVDFDLYVAAYEAGC